MTKLESKAWHVIDDINKEIAQTVKAGITGKRLTMMTLKGETVFASPLGMRSPGTRVWTRGDGNRYKDPGYIKVHMHFKSISREYSTFKTMFKNDKQAILDYVWEKLKNTRGAKELGTVSGEYRTSEHSPALRVHGMLWIRREWGVEFGSLSRLKSKYGVWHLTPKEKI